MQMQSGSNILCSQDYNQCGTTEVKMVLGSVRR